MSAKTQLSGEQRRATLDVLPRDRLGQIAEHLPLEEADPDPLGRSDSKNAQHTDEDESP